MDEEELAERFSLLYKTPTPQPAEPKEFVGILESLEEGDIIMLLFKRHFDWARVLYALIMSNPNAFEIIGPGIASWNLVKKFRDTGHVSSSKWPVALKVLTSLGESFQEMIPSIVDYLSPITDVVEVIRPE
jgi:hypothetical protein